MTVTALGSTTIGEALPLTLASQTAASVALGASLANLQAQLDGAIEASVKLTATPPSITALLDGAVALVAAINAAIALGVPTASVQLAAVLDVIAELTSRVGELQLQLDALAEIPLGGSISAYVFDGRSADFGSEIQGATAGGLGPSGPSANAFALLLAADTPAGRLALQAMAGVS